VKTIRSKKHWAKFLSSHQGPIEFVKDVGIPKKQKTLPFDLMTPPPSPAVFNSSSPSSSSSASSFPTTITISTSPTSSSSPATIPIPTPTNGLQVVTSSPSHGHRETKSIFLPLTHLRTNDLSEDGKTTVPLPISPRLASHSGSGSGPTNMSNLLHTISEEFGHPRQRTGSTASTIERLEKATKGILPSDAAELKSLLEDARLEIARLKMLQVNHGDHDLVPDGIEDNPSASDNEGEDRPITPTSSPPPDEKNRKGI